jgi:hypothetical protein
MLVINENEIKHFNFGVEVKGTKETPTARLVFEGNGNHKMFPVTSEDGKFVHSLSYDALKELQEGLVYLEVLVGKTYFRPWEDKYTIKGAIVNESVAPIKKQIISEEVKKPEPKKEKPQVPAFKVLRLEYKNLLKAAGVSFLLGESNKNFEIKKKVLTIMENKYGRQVRPDLLKLNSIKIDELLIY